jgi:hypothetical protein
MSFADTLDALVDEGAVAWGLLAAALIVVASRRWSSGWRR